MASTIKVNNIQNQCGANIANKCGTTITLGASGDTITLACGASQTGFGRTGTVDWDTTAKTSAFTAVSGNGYFVNTTSGAITVTLPATPSAGDIVAVADYAGTSVTNNITIARNGSNIEGLASDLIIENNGISMTFVYVDGTRGWKVTGAGRKADSSSISYIEATGGTITTCGDYKIHTFTGPGTFTVCAVGDIGTVDYMVVAGGGSGGGTPTSSDITASAGGGAGGFRSNYPSCCSGVPVTIQSYPITVGAGGAGGQGSCNPNQPGNNGSNSIFSTITSTGGGKGGVYGNPTGTNGSSGGSGGGGGFSQGGFATSGGAGNTPPVSPSQGNSGGAGGTNASSGGGGGAGAVGSAPGPGGGGAGGNGTANSISGSSVTYAGGGGGGSEGGSGASGGSGGGGDGGDRGALPGAAATSGTANTGGGGGGGANGTSSGPDALNKYFGSGGSGIVIIRYKFQ